jgi:hypothetical protein
MVVSSLEEAARWHAQTLAQFSHINNALFGLSLALIAGTASIATQPDAQGDAWVMNLLVATFVLATLALLLGAVSAVVRLGYYRGNARIASEIPVLGEASPVRTNPKIVARAGSLANSAMLLQFATWVSSLSTFCAALWRFLLLASA